MPKVLPQLLSFFIPVEDRRLPPPDVQEKLTGESPAKTGAQIKFATLQKRDSWARIKFETLQKKERLGTNKV